MTTLSTFALNVPLLLAADPPAVATDRSYSVSWALILLSVILGLLVTLRPARRTSEIKKPPRN
jgi:hypothetical protein